MYFCPQCPVHIETFLDEMQYGYVKSIMCKVCTFEEYFLKQK